MSDNGIIGERFGRWIVLDVTTPYVWVSKDGTETQRHERLSCQCDCGKIKPVRKQYLTRGTSRSCGCLERELSRARATKHGYCGTKEYNAWIEMKRRCLNPNFNGYAYYGGRGITIQDSWMEDFENFFNDVGEAPSDEFSLDRIDSNGHYTKGNVKWSTRSDQNKNQRKLSGSSRFKYTRYHKQSGKWISSIWVEGKIVHLGQFETEEEAAIKSYTYHMKLYGEWPPYSDEDLVLLGIGDDYFSDVVYEVFPREKLITVFE